MSIGQEKEKTMTIPAMLLEEKELHRVQRMVCNMSNQEIQNAIDEALVIMGMGLMSGQDLERLKKGASFLSYILLRRQGISP